MKRILILTAAAFALAACGEKPQQMKDSPKQDASAFQGTGSAFAAPGWKAGDKAAWEAQLKTRTQNGQNDYTKVN